MEYTCNGTGGAFDVLCNQAIRTISTLSGLVQLYLFSGFYKAHVMNVFISVQGQHRKSS